VNVISDGPQLNDQAVCDLLIGEAFADELQQPTLRVARIACSPAETDSLPQNLR
jgi:hypothetical protein